MAIEEPRKPAAAGLALIGPLAAHLRTPLYRNGYLLTLNGFLTSGLGLVYWAVAAHSYSLSDVGVSAAAIAAMVLLSGAAQLGLNGVMVRFLPLAGQGTVRLVVYSYLISVAVAAAISSIFLLGLGLWAPALRFLTASPAAGAAFVLATMAWTIFTIQDSVMTGLRRTEWVPLENTSFAVVKIALLAAFAASLPRLGIFVSWTIPVALSLAPINVLIFRYLIPAHRREASAGAPAHRPGVIVRFVAGNYLGSLFFLASTTLLPLVVTDVAGTRANAHFYVPWMICTALQLVAVNMTTSLTVEAARDESRLSLYGRRVLVQSARLLLPAIAVCLIGAPAILRVFGSGYAADGTMLLRLLALAVMPALVTTLAISVARVRNRAGDIVMAQGALCILLLGSSAILLRAFGVSGVGWAYLASQSAVAAWLALTQLRPLWRDVAWRQG